MVPPPKRETKPLLSVNTVDGETPYQEARLGTWYSTFINLFLTAAGTGILSLPFTFAQTGIVTGNVMLFFMAIISAYSMDLLVRCSILTGCTSYEDLGRKCYGKAGEYAIKINLLFLLFGACVLFMIVFVGLLVPFFEFLFKDHHRALEVLTNHYYLTAIGVVAVFPLTMLKSLHGLRFTSTAGVFCLLYVMVILVVKLIETRHMAPSVVPVVMDAKNLWKLCVALPIQGIAYCAQFSVLPLYGEIERPSHGRMNSVIYSFGFACFVLYAVVGCVGYALFGSSALGNILENFPDQDVLVNVGRCLLAATILLKLPLCSLPFRETLNGMLFPQKTVATWIIFIENVILLAVAAVLAVTLKNLNTALGILGGTTGVCISFIFPAALYLRCAELSPLKKIPSILMIIFGIAVGVLGIVTQFVKL